MERPYNLSLVRDVTHAEYHRNGVGGEGFWEVRFTTDAGNGESIGVIAILTDSECYVVTPSDIRQHWRGTDYFREPLRRFIEATKCPRCGLMRDGLSTLPCRCADDSPEWAD